MTDTQKELEDNIPVTQERLNSMTEKWSSWPVGTFQSLSVKPSEPV